MVAQNKDNKKRPQRDEEKEDLVYNDAKVYEL